MRRFLAASVVAATIFLGAFFTAAQENANLDDALAKLKGWKAKVSRDKATGTILAIDFGKTAITDADLAVLKQTPNLRRLEIDRTKTTDAALVHLKDLKQLQALDLEFTAVTDDGLKQIRHLTGLKSIDLEGTKITGAGLVHLQGMTELRDLDLRNTSVTPDDAKKLRESLPKVGIKTGTLPRQ